MPGLVAFFGSLESSRLFEVYTPSAAGTGQAEEQLRGTGVGDEHRRVPAGGLRLGVGQLVEEGGALQAERHGHDRVGRLAGDAADLRGGRVVVGGLDGLLVDDLEAELVGLLLERVDVGLAELVVDVEQRDRWRPASAR